jgi:protocatechuate 3,4-dioxygenase beta subunit
MGGTAAGSSAAAGSGAPGFVPVMFDNVASCTLTPTDPAGEGPFFVHEDEIMNDEVLLRFDMRDGKPGVELQLNLRVLDSDGKCMKPISGIEVYTWHTDATGFYSGFNNQNPDQPYSGSIERTVENMDRFCRGIQITDSDGIVRFKTVYPGWYNGRAIHIHFLALRPGSGADTSNYRSSKSMVFTTQLYFAEQFSRMIHEHNAPYSSRASGAAYEKYVKPQNTTVNPTMRMEGNIAVGALTIITSSTGSRR